MFVYSIFSGQFVMDRKVLYIDDDDDDDNDDDDDDDVLFWGDFCSAASFLDL